MSDANSYPVTQKFGYDPRYPLNNGFHQGVDYGCPDGTPVVVNGVTIGYSGHSGTACHGPHVHVGKFTSSGSVQDPTGQGWNFTSAKVITVSSDAADGNFVRILADGNYYVYLHLSKQTCSVGQVLTKPAEDRGIMNEEDAKEVYRAVLHREPENDQVWRGLVGKRFAAVAIAIRGSQEWLTQNHVLLKAFPEDEQKVGQLSADLAAERAKDEQEERQKPAYERLAAPLAVRTKADVPLWDLSSDNFTDGGNSRRIAMLPVTTTFTAVGKATRNDLPGQPVFFMSAESFGEADKTGIPVYNQGVNTVDLEPAATAPTQPAIAIVTSVTPEAEQASTPVVVAAPTDGDRVEVKVLPHDPEGWKKTYIAKPGKFIAQQSTIIHDLEAVADDSQLLKDQDVDVAGEFTGPDGKTKYYRTVRSADGWIDKDGNAHPANWKGIPIECLDDHPSLFTYMDDVIEDFKDGIGQVNIRRKAVLKAAKLHGELNWLSDRLKKKGKKV